MDITKNNLGSFTNKTGKPCDVRFIWRRFFATAFQSVKGSQVVIKNQDMWTIVNSRFFFSLHLELDEHGEHDLTILPSWSMSKLLGLFSISLILLWSTHLVNNMLRDPWPVEVLLETRGFPFHVCFKQNAVIKLVVEHRFGMVTDNLLMSNLANIYTKKYLLN